MSTAKKMLAKVVKSRCLFFSTAIVTSLVINSQVVSQVNDRADHYDIPAQPLEDSLNAFARQADVEVLYTSDDVRAIEAPAISGAASREQAIARLLAGTGLTFRFTDGGTLIVRAPDKTSATAARAGRIEMARVAQQRRAVATVGFQGVEDNDDQEDREKDKDMEEMVVTGSNIRGIAPDSSPLFVFERDEIERSGFGTVEQLLEVLPQNFGGGAAPDTSGTVDDVDAVANFGRRASTVNLRGLGADSTLVLINGRRLAPTGNASFVDISVIPLSAVERVEVLTDGASAIYGSDAVGGVVNFVLRDDYDGAETLLRYGTVTDGSLDEYKAGQTVGRSWSSGNAIMSYEYLRQDNLPVTDRDFAVDAGARPTFDLLPETERHSIFASVNQKLTGGVEVFAEAAYTNRDVESNSGTRFAERVTVNINNYFFSGGASFGLVDDWQGEVSLGYVVNNSDSKRQFVDFPVEIDGELDNSIWTADAKADGTVFHLPGGQVKLAAGLGYREEELVSGNSVSSTTLDRSVVAAFGELFIPVFSEQNRVPGIERLEFSVAGRFEDYSDFGSTTDPKLGVLWSPVRDLNLRGTYGTSFRAPGLTDTDPDDSGLGATLFNFDFADAPNGTGRILILGLVGQARELDPEESTTWTVGLDYQPEAVPGLKLSATYYDIEFDNRIARPAQSVVTPFRTNPEFFTPLFTFDPTPEQIALGVNSPGFFDLTTNPTFGPPSDPADTELLFDNRLQNIAITNTNGVDLSVSYWLPTDVGEFSFAFNGNYVFNFEEAITVASPLLDVVDTVFNPVDLRFRANVGWVKDGFTAFAYINYTDSYTDDQADMETKVDSWTTLDLFFSYNTGDRFSAWWLRDLKVSLSVQNVFDNDPPSISGPPSPFFSVGYDPANATPLNRFVAFQISKAW